ncbi:MAG: DNA adenine methylase [Tissierellia bacterium]|nr:DNA adenine methylase [Tissierellia bacterium]
MRTDKKKYIKPPIPFKGNKKNALKILDQELDQREIKSNTIIDLFGGSGLLSHFFKVKYPEKRVIFNDFENYSYRLKCIDDTNERLDELRKLLNGRVKRGSRIRGEELEKEVGEIFERSKDKRTIASQLIYHAKAHDKENFYNHHLYNNVRKTPFEKMESYLDGVEVVKKDYKELITDYKEPLYLIDPPYCGTHVEGYAKGQTPKEWFELFDIMKKMKNYIFFTSEVSISGRILTMSMKVIP